MKTKGIITTVFAAIACLNMYAANEINVFKEGTIFECTAYSDTSVPLVEYPMIQELSGTQVIDGTEYILLHETINDKTETEYGLREDSGKVYAISLEHPDYGEKLIYDFTLKPGDEAVIYDGKTISGENIMSFNIKCVSTENFSNNNLELSRINLAIRESDSDFEWEVSWIDGIGSMAGVMWNFAELYAGGGVVVDRVICNGETVYESKTTGVSSMNNDSVNRNSIRYNLDGTIATQNSTGIYIENGKKHLRK